MFLTDFFGNFMEILLEYTPIDLVREKSTLSVDDFVQPGTKPLPEIMFTSIHNAI